MYLSLCSTLYCNPRFVWAAYGSIAMVSNLNVAVTLASCWQCNPISLVSLILVWLGQILLVEVIDNLFQMFKSWRIVPLFILVVPFLLDTKLHFSTYYLLFYFFFGIQYIINLLFFFVVNYNWWGRVIVLTKKEISKGFPKQARVEYVMEFHRGKQL